jgi:hypothetical protein
MALYLARYLNVPPARISGDGRDLLDNLPTGLEALRATLLDALDRHSGSIFATHQYSV